MPEIWPKEILDVTNRTIGPSIAEDVQVQLFALGLITHGAKKRTMSDHNRYWGLTPSGRDLVMRLHAIRRPTADESVAAQRSELEALTEPQLRSLAQQELGRSGKGRKADLIDAILNARS